MHSVTLVMQTAAPLSFVFKSEPPVGVAQTITQLEESSEAGTAKRAIGGESVGSRSA